MISFEIRLFIMTWYVWATHVYEGLSTTPYDHSLASCVPKSGPWTGYPYAFRCQRTVMYIQVVNEVFRCFDDFFSSLQKGVRKEFGNLNKLCCIRSPGEWYVCT